MSSSLKVQLNLGDFPGCEIIIKVYFIFSFHSLLLSLSTYEVNPLSPKFPILQILQRHNIYFKVVISGICIAQVEFL